MWMKKWRYDLGIGTRKAWNFNQNDKSTFKSKSLKNGTGYDGMGYNGIECFQN